MVCLKVGILVLNKLFFLAMVFELLLGVREPSFFSVQEKL